MKFIAVVLLKVFAREFYSRHAMFFLVIVGLCFGFMSGTEHQALARMFVSNPALLMIPVSVWLLYACTVVMFNRKMLVEARNAFTHHITLLDTSAQYLLIFPILVAQFIPVIGYAFFLIVISCQGNFVLATILIVLSACTLLCTSVMMLQYDFKNQLHEKKILVIKRLIDTHFSKPYIQFFIEWISRKNPVILLGTKFLCCLILFGILKLYNTDAYDWRLLGIGLTIIFSGNMSLLFELHRFENSDFQLIRNLPLSLSRRLINNILSFIVLCLPEFGILIRDFPAELSYFNLISSILFSLSLMVLLYSSLYAMPVDLEKFTRKVFVVSIVETVMVLFNVPMWIIAVINFAGGAMLFNKYFYTYETVANAKQ